MSKPVAVVTGASSGIGAATAKQLAASGYRVVLGARREDKLRSVAQGLDADIFPLDVTDSHSVIAFAENVPAVNLLINNAGGAFGLEPIAEAEDEKWQAMWDINVMGLIRVTRALLPKLKSAEGGGQIINVGSIAGIETYTGGAGYTAAKHAVRAITDTLRLELLGQPVRVCEIAPGSVETDFSTVRFAGDTARAAKVYEGMTPLTADDIADAIVWMATRPAHVNIDYMLIRPLDQARAALIHRKPQNDGE